MRAPRDKLPSIASSQPAGAQVPDHANDVSRPKLGRHGRREIGRALEAMYEDVVNQGVPPRIRKLLESLDTRAGSSPDAP
jgi:Anti-sigma factor NepR